MFNPAYIYHVYAAQSIKLNRTIDDSTRTRYHIFPYTVIYCCVICICIILLISNRFIDVQFVLMTPLIILSYHRIFRVQIYYLFNLWLQLFQLGLIYYSICIIELKEWQSTTSDLETNHRYILGQLLTCFLTISCNSCTINYNLLHHTG